MSGVTVAALIEEAAGRLRAAGVIKPRREANRLWAWQHRVNPGESWLTRERAAGAEPARAFEDAVARRVRGEPLAYILGHTGFRQLEIRCDRRALIPRPETEGVVELALALVKEGRALDLGTGTGCLALALRDEGQFQVTGVDRAPDPLALAAENAAALGLAVELVESDLDQQLRGRTFELLVSNPPYLTEAEYQALPDAVKAWEPREALVGGADGLAITRRILEAGQDMLVPGGWLVMEIDCARSDAVARMAGSAGWQDVRVESDLFGRDRYLAARRAANRGGVG
jgi:release factor glutamine methyltransferase